MEPSTEVNPHNKDPKDPPSVADFDLDENLVHLGVRGFFPTGLFLFLAFFVVFTPSQYMSTHVGSFPVEHRCRLPIELLDNLTAHHGNLSSAAMSLEDLIPHRVVDGQVEFASCERFQSLDGFDSGAARHL